MTTIYFDMDGTIANFYAVANWLEYLINENPYPYKIAKPLLHFSTFARILHKAQSAGYNIGIISWLSKSGSDSYNEIVTEVKKEWLRKHLPSVTFDVIHIVPYGTPKESFATINDILFDDEERNRNNWCGTAYDVNNIFEILKEIINNGN